MYALIPVRKMKLLNGDNSCHHNNHTHGKFRQATGHPCPSSKPQTSKLGKTQVKRKYSVYLGVG